MKILIHIFKDGSLGSFGKGLDKHNVSYTVGMNHQDPLEYDLIVQLGHNTIPKHCTDYLVEENSFYNKDNKWNPIGKRVNRSLGFNGHNGEADFVNNNSDDSRLSGASLLQPYDWDEKGHVLIIGQTPGDSSLKSKYIPPIDIDLWIQEQKEKYTQESHTKLPHSQS